jgi:hypothetical protein
VFAALGDETRLRLVGKLSHGQPYSISQLAEGIHLNHERAIKPFEAWVNKSDRLRY